jgi:hypothetical protein
MEILHSTAQELPSKVQSSTPVVPLVTMAVVESTGANRERLERDSQP